MAKNWSREGFGVRTIALGSRNWRIIDKLCLDYEQDVGFLLYIGKFYSLVFINHR